MRRSLLVIVTALTLCGATAVAQAANAEPFVRPHHVSVQDIAAFADARIAALKAGLQLKPDQEKNWPALETALREIAKTRVAHFEEWRDKAPPSLESDPLGALRQRAQHMAARAGELDKVAAAAKPLYDNLDEAQKRRFGALVHAAIKTHMGHMGGHMGGVEHMGGRGPGEFGAGLD
ncbi:Spy/CpxP family protein refolding chaperone [Methylocystis sp. MJC1]|jgi:hypothetical protein|uniref:Spy/CpxP family protein refolding chaperone n=1 Tax=Methylocystis sp. MJC1 TaxID=2654282 RepID=UPI0013EB7A5F|nr:Spy/CpxP family protein refolding chaperone [Methylocystis sp. MJC1]KAF2991074.1 hypothetical protein MJC1_01806 [Methylocystis sp. MJC1]MBU6526005.1 Spy/CpxP family protein refolding chaperone [Methylocystis sp. MJC1]UZX12472.1 Spy/CpxP family protein refolding chaperone [Methylocystis sp. MJC1]